MRDSVVLVFGLIVSAASFNVASATDIYVDNLLGNDGYDGLLELPVDTGSGPVKSLHRAMQIAGFGDRILLTRAGATYFDSLSLTGTRHSGTVLRPFTIIGNGAILSGARTVPANGWRRTMETDLWKLSMTRKGFYRLMRDGQPLSELLHEEGVNPLEKLAAGQWTAWRGEIYFRQDGDLPSEQSFSHAAEQTGISLYQVENVRIVGLTLRDFRFDGVHAQNMCRGVTLENINCLNNGRCGVAVSGSSRIEIVGGSLSENGRHSLLVSNRAAARLSETTTDVEPTLAP